MSFFARFLCFAAAILAQVGIPWYGEWFVPQACSWLAHVSGYLAGYPEVVHGAMLQAHPGAFYVKVVDECLGIEPWLVYCAAVLAFPLSVRRRVIAIVLGLGFVSAYNVLRVALLYHVGLWSLEAAVWAHKWVFNTPFLLSYLVLLYLVTKPNHEAETLRQRLRIPQVDVDFWGTALVVLTISIAGWQAFGQTVVAAVMRTPTQILVDMLSLGNVSDIVVLPLSTDEWRVVIPSFSQGVDRKDHFAAISCVFVAYLLLPLVCFSLCQSLLGGAARWHGKTWMNGIGFCMLWYGLGVIVAAVHIQSLAATHATNLFPRHIDPPSYTLVAPEYLKMLFYGSGWLFEVFFVLSNVIGFALWADMANKKRDTTDAQP